jgi:hypothetical protein
MTLPRDLEDWFTSAGDRVMRKRATSGEASLSKEEKLIYELWLLDTEVRRGGLSQYFASRGLEEWEHCVALVSGAVPSFARFAERLGVLLRLDLDRTGPGLRASIASGAEANELYYESQIPIVTELRDVVRSSAEPTETDQLRITLSIPWRYYFLGLLAGMPLLIVAVLLGGKWTPSPSLPFESKITFYFGSNCQSPTGAPQVDITSSNSQLRPAQAWKSLRVGSGAFALHGGESFERPRWPTCHGWYAAAYSECVAIPDDLGPVRSVEFLSLGGSCVDAIAKCNSGNTAACRHVVTACGIVGVEVIEDIGRTKTCR